MDKFLAQYTINMTITRECSSRGEAEALVSKAMDECHNDYLADGMKVVALPDGNKSYKQLLATEGELVITMSHEIKETE